MNEHKDTGPSLATNFWLAVAVILIAVMNAVDNGPLLVAILLVVAAMAGGTHKVLNRKKND